MSIRGTLYQCKVEACPLDEPFTNMQCMSYMWEDYPTSACPTCGRIILPVHVLHVGGLSYQCMSYMWEDYPTSACPYMWEEYPTRACPYMWEEYPTSACKCTCLAPACGRSYMNTPTLVCRLVHGHTHTDLLVTWTLHHRVT